IDQPTSVEDEKLAASVAVYPNPTPGMARITIPNGAAVSVSIANQLGEVLYRTTATGEIMWNGMDMSGNIVAPGAYYVHVQSATATAVMPLSIVR
ncbi:MAG: FlgD immunoglobulin-like domain containing protein, partial [Ignavibacteria bacterium]